MNKPKLTYFGEWYNIPLFYCLFWYHPSVNQGIKRHFHTSRRLAFWVINRKEYLFLETRWLNTLKSQIQTTNPKILLKQLKQFYTIFQKNKNILTKNKVCNYSKLSNDDLSDKLHTVLHAIHSVTPFDQYCMIAEPFYLQEFEDYLKKQLKEVSKEHLFNEFRAVLTTPVNSTSPQVEELALITLALKRKKMQLSQKDITSHLDAFGWLPLFLFGKEWDTKYVLSEVERLIEDPHLLDRKKHLEQYSQIQERKIAAMMKQLPEQSLWPELMREIGFIRNEAETIISLGTKVLTPLYAELQKRLNCGESELSCLTLEEITVALDGELNVKAIASQRKSALVCATSVNSIEITAGVPALKWFKDVYEAQENTKFSNLSGTCASLGTAKGKVKIIKGTDDIHKFERGNILVAEATCIDYVPIMRKAAAIVTSMGGLTSHAAIVSRELGIPCIVGVNAATKVLKDGDLVNVDANNGIVEVVKH